MLRRSLLRFKKTNPSNPQIWGGPIPHPATSDAYNVVYRRLAGVLALNRKPQSRYQRAANGRTEIELQLRCLFHNRF